MIGETLEQHCETEFNKLRSTAFQKSYFEKDNDSKSGTKGDYIYRENDEHGNEIISIMFEMKNEADATASKRKNEEFFKVLDKNRNEKKCEYAVLVSTLEADNDLYNMGTVDVSYKSPKMYVIRPQFFIPIITLLRNASMNSMQYKAELSYMKNHIFYFLAFGFLGGVLFSSFFKVSFATSIFLLVITVGVFVYIFRRSFLKKEELRSSILFLVSILRYGLFFLDYRIL
jgi:hypothetical protein